MLVCLVRIWLQSPLVWFLSTTECAARVKEAVPSFCEDNTTTNSITVQHKKIVPVNFDGSNAQLFTIKSTSSVTTGPEINERPYKMITKLIKGHRSTVSQEARNSKSHSTNVILLKRQMNTETSHQKKKY
jgi:hypothetical protein